MGRFSLPARHPDWLRRKDIPTTQVTDAPWWLIHLIFGSQYSQKFLVGGGYFRIRSELLLAEFGPGGDCDYRSVNMNFRALIILGFCFLLRGRHVGNLLSGGVTVRIPANVFFISTIIRKSRAGFPKFIFCVYDVAPVG